MFTVDALETAQRPTSSSTSEYRGPAMQLEIPDNSGRPKVQETLRIGCPRVSVGLPVYNGERYLRLAIDSILAQTFEDFELIISDNASTDHTEEICREYAARDPRVIYIRQPRNRGGAWNFNHVVELARGEYLKWAAHDDVLAPTFLKECVAALDRLPGTVLASPRTVKIDESGKRESAGYTAHAHRFFVTGRPFSRPDHRASWLLSGLRAHSPQRIAQDGAHRDVWRLGSRVVG